MPDYLPVAIVRFPEVATHPVFVRFEGVEIEVAICSRETFAGKQELPPQDWSVMGVYLLSGPAIVPGGLRRVRPGTTAVRPLIERIEDHLKDLDWWDQVVMIRRPSREFDNAEAGYLETLLHRLVDSAVALERVKGDNASHFAGPASTDGKADLEGRVLEAMRVALRLAGLRIETQEEADEVAALPVRRRNDELRHA